MTNLSIRRRLLVCLLPMFAWISLTFPSRANDTSAELATGGLAFVKNLDVEMVSEDLFISTEEIRIVYRFCNKSNKMSQFTWRFRYQI